MTNNKSIKLINVRTNNLSYTYKIMIFKSSLFLNLTGRIEAAQLEYSDAHKHLLQAMRKAPQHSAMGFKQTVSSDLFKKVFDDVITST